MDAINNLLEEGEYDCVIVLSDKIISEVSQQNDSVNNLIYFNAVSLKSSALFHLDEKEKAIELNELALQQLEDKEVEANVYPKLLQDKGYFLSNSGQFKQAIKVNKEAVSKMLTETREDSLIIRNILNNIGVSFRKIGFLDSSIFYYERMAAYNSLKDRTDSISLAHYYLNISVSYGDLYGPNIEREYAIKAYNIRKRLLGKNNIYVATALNNLAYTYRVQGDYARAISYMEEVLEIYESLFVKDHPRIANAKANLANAYYRAGNRAKSESLYQEAISFFLKNYSTKSLVHLTNYSRVKLELNQVLRAEELLNWAVKISEKLEVRSHPYLIRLYTQLAEVHIDKNDTAKAIHAFQVLDTLISEMGSFNTELARNCNVRANFYLELEKEKDALKYINESLRIISGGKLEEGEIVNVEACVNEIVALNSLNIYMRFLNRYQPENVETEFSKCIKKFYELSSKIQRQGNVLSDYSKLYEARRKNYAEILHFFHEHKHSFDDLLSISLNYHYDEFFNNADYFVNQGNTRLTSSITDLVEEKRLLKYWMIKSEESGASSDYNKLVFDSQRRIDSLYNYLSDSKGLIDSSIVLSRVRSILEEYSKDKTLALTFLETENFFYRIELGRGQLSRVKRPELEKEIDLLDDLLHFKSAGDELPKVSNSILKSLFKDIELSESSEIIVCLNGTLEKLNFDMLSTSEDDYVPLIKSHTVKYVDSFYSAKRPEKKSSSKQFSISAFSSKSDSLRTVAEITSISQLFREKGSYYFDTTEEDFFKNAPNSDVIHLATHTSNDSEDLLESKFSFGGNSVKISSLLNLNLDASLSFLSACNTGSKSFREGMGSTSISRLFRQAGCRALVMTQWKIPDETTPEIVIEFYKNLIKGQRKSEALRKAKLTYLENQGDPLKRHPYFWAGFVLIGDDSPIEFEERPPGWYWLAGGMFPVFLLLVFIRKRIQSNS